MNDQQLNNLIRMVEQITANNLHHGNDDNISYVVADHLHKFWARSMKQQIIAYADESPTELSPLARSAIAKLRGLSE